MAVARAKHVSVESNHLPERWLTQQANIPFVIAETGFGQGVNFLVTLMAWLALPLDIRRHRRLYYFSVEINPFIKKDLQQLLSRCSELADVARELLNQWPAVSPGMHRLIFDHQRVVLDVWFGHAQEGLDQWSGRADAWYLDGFSPTKNPDMWKPRVFYTMARRSKHLATVSTYTDAAPVHEGLMRAGFTVTKSKGFDPKKDMLKAQLHPQAKPLTATAKPKTVAVVGAGMAGVWAAYAIANASADTSIILIDQHPAPAMGASGNEAGAFGLHVSRDDSRLSQLTRLGTEFTRRSLQELTRRGLLVRGRDWDCLGHLQLAESVDESEKFKQVVSDLQFPRELLQYVSAEQAHCLIDQKPAHGGWWFPQEGWVIPHRWVNAALQSMSSAVTFIGNSSLHAYAYDETASQWQLWVDQQGQRVTMQACELVIANADQCAQFMPGLNTALSTIKGQISHVKPLPTQQLQSVVSGSAYGIPLPDGTTVIGATYERPADNIEVTESAHRQNIERWLATFPQMGEPMLISGRSAIRAAWIDRLPMIGRYVGEHTTKPVYVATGYSSRGISWSVLAGEHIAAMMLQHPTPLVNRLAESVDPMRFQPTSAGT